MDGDGSDVVLAVDPAISTGWTLLSVKGAETAQVVVTVHKWGCIVLEGSSDQEKSYDLYTQLKKLMQSFRIKHLVTEGYTFSRKRCNGCLLNVYLRGVVMQLGSENALQCNFINVGDWKRFLMGSKGLRAEKAEVIGALQRKYGAIFPDKMKSNKTGRPVQFKHDVSDSCAMAVYHITSQYTCKPLVWELDFKPTGQDNFAGQHNLLSVSIE